MLIEQPCAIMGRSRPLCRTLAAEVLVRRLTDSLTIHDSDQHRGCHRRGDRRARHRRRAPPAWRRGRCLRAGARARRRRGWDQPLAQCHAGARPARRARRRPTDGGRSTHSTSATPPGGSCSGHPSGRPAAPALCAYRPDLIEALADQLPDGSLRTGKALASVEVDADRAQLAFDDQTTAEADIVVGADGIRSAVRAFVTGDTSAPVYRGHPIWRGIGPLPNDFVGGEISESWGDGQRFGLLSVGEGRAYWYATANRPRVRPTADPRRGRPRCSPCSRTGTARSPRSSGPRRLRLCCAAIPTTAAAAGGGAGAGPCSSATRRTRRRRTSARAGVSPLRTASYSRGPSLSPHLPPKRSRRTRPPGTGGRLRVTRESLWTGRLGQAGRAGGAPEHGDADHTG